jgi:hypothetical protein
MDTKRPKLRLEFDDGKTWIIRVQPVDEYIDDVDEPGEMDEAIWAVAGALDGRSSRQLIGVWRYIEQFTDTHPAIAVPWALWHPRTPFALGYQPWQHPVYREQGIEMYVVWRGMCYTRNKRGVLANGKPFPNWPTPEIMAAAIARAQKGEGA